MSNFKKGAVQLERNYNLWSFILCLILLGLSIQALYASFHHTWQWAPDALTLWILAMGAFVIGIKGFGDKSNKRAKWRSWLTMLISVPLLIVFFLGVMVNTFTREHIETSYSPDAEIRIDFYTLNGGAATSISVSGIVNGPLWFKKRIYFEDRMQTVNVEWENDHAVTINRHTLNLEEGETFFD